MNDATPRHKHRVLIIDDSRFARRLIRQILEESGEFVVIGEAADGKGGLCEFHRINPDLITLDYDMPRMDGIEMLRELRKESDLPVVFVTALPFATELISDDAEQLQISAVVMKSFTEYSVDLSLFADELLRSVRLAISAGARTD